MPFASLHASPWAHSLLSLRLFLRCILEFWCVRTTLTRIGRTKFPQLVSRLLCSSVRSMKTSAASRLKYATQMSCIFQHSHCSLVTIHFRLFARLFLSTPVHECTLIAEFTLRLCFVFLTLGWVSIAARWSCAIPLKYSVHGGRDGFPDGLRPLRILLLEHFVSSFSFSGSEDEVDIGVVFTRLLSSCRKLQLSPFEHCPFA